MEFYKIDLLSQKKAYVLREYFPYANKPFFKSLDSILKDELLQSEIVNLFVQMYKGDLIFNYPLIDKHDYFYSIKFKSNKFTKINNLIADKLAKQLDIKLIDDICKKMNI